MNLDFERKLFGRGYETVGGIDEAGRGPMAGPVVAACVLIRASDKVSAGLRKVADSKTISEKTRRQAYEAIRENFEYIGVGVCDNREIDRLNILQATFLAMKRAREALKADPEYLVLDGPYTVPGLKERQEAVIDGDRKVFSVAAASIIAKVTRDRIMIAYHQDFPDYGFNRHKGYCTKMHFERIRKFGPCPIHRKSFAPVRKWVTGAACSIRANKV